MKAVVAVLVICAIWVTVAIAAPEEKYTDEFDGINVEEILNTDRLLTNYVNCLKTGNKCTPDGQKLRDILPDALKTNCSKCTETQARQSRVVLRFFIKEKIDVFKELEEMFDPTHEYRKAYASELAKDGIILPD